MSDTNISNSIVNIVEEQGTVNQRVSNKATVSFPGLLPAAPTCSSDATMTWPSYGSVSLASRQQP